MLLQLKYAKEFIERKFQKYFQHGSIFFEAQNMDKKIKNLFKFMQKIMEVGFNWSGGKNLIKLIQTDKFNKTWFLKKRQGLLNLSFKLL